MGGPGSGNFYHWWRSKKAVVEDCLSLDANRWTREGILKAGAFTSGLWKWTYADGHNCSVSYVVDTRDGLLPEMWLQYSWRGRPGGEGGSAEYRVYLTTTRPRFGGLRWWFVCPLARGRGGSCSRRVGKLHLPPGAHYFGCRQCHALTYTSCQTSRKYDSFYRLMAEAGGWDFGTVKAVMDGIGKRRR